MKRVISVLLALLMLLTFVACGSDEGGEQAGTTTPAPGGQTPGGQTPGGSENPGGTTVIDPKTVLEVGQMDFKEKELVILQRTEYASEMYVEKYTGDLVPDTIYDRNKAVEDYLNVTLMFEVAPGSPRTYGTATTGYKDVLTTSLTSGEEVYHIAGDYAYQSPRNIGGKDSLYRDLNAIPEDVNFLSLEKIWWNQSFQKETTINNQQYFVVGDLTTSAMERLQIMVYNENLLQQYLEEDPEEFLNHVYNRTWTYQYLLDCIAKVGDGGSAGGVWGSVMQCNSTSIDGFLCGLAVDLVQRDSRGGAEPSFNSQRTLDIGNALRALYQTNPGAYSDEVDQNEDAEYPLTIFEQSRSVFFAGMMGTIGSNLKNLPWDYAVIPFPIYDDNQTEYRSTPHDEYTVLGIPATVEASLDAVTATLEVMACKSYEMVRPALFEKSYKTRYLKTAPKAMMFDYIVENAYYDFGYVYSTIFNNPLHVLRNFVRYYPGTSTYIEDLSVALGTIADASATSLQNYLERFF